MGDSKISWLKNPDGSPGKTWPLAEGCTKVSTGCTLCCAERVFKHWHPQGNFAHVHLKPNHLEDPLHWKKPQRILVDFMFDLFHSQIPTQYITDIFAVMAACPQHTFLILTKRAEIMRHFIVFSGKGEKVAQSLEKIYAGHGWCPDTDFTWPLPNVWLGVSVEDQVTANRRIPMLLHTPSAHRFVSYEPALSPIDFRFYEIFFINGESTYKADLLDWIIMGCESGNGARPMDIEWARSVRDECQAGNVPFYFKQMMVDGNLIHTPSLDGRFWDEIP